MTAVNYFMLWATGGVVAVVMTLVFVLTVVLRHVSRTLRYTGDGGILDVVRVYTSGMVVYMRDNIDWRLLVNRLLCVYGVGFVVTWLGTLLWVGFTHVYL